jgi:hypothetical protein
MHLKGGPVVSVETDRDSLDDVALAAFEAQLGTGYGKAPVPAVDVDVDEPGIEERGRQPLFDASHQ